MKGGILMLKFQIEYNTYIKTFEDFILTTFVIIDDLYKKFAPYQVAHRRNLSIAKLSDSEIMTISICGELIGIDSENAWYSFVKRNYHHLFPFEITPASTDDRDGLRDMLENETNMVIIGDKGYISEKLSDKMKCKGICVMALKRSNSKNNWTKPIRQLIFKLRRRVETVFSQLSLQLNSERVLAKSFQGLCTRLVILLEYSIPSDTISIKFEYDKII